jgi:hypothetical protein
VVATAGVLVDARGRRAGNVGAIRLGCHDRLISCLRHGTPRRILWVGSDTGELRGPLLRD